MDTFMDKLAQRLTAQEIIKANTAADAEEMNKLKNQIAEYNQCLERLQKLIEEGALKLQDSRTDGEQITRLVEESIEKIRAIQQDSQGLQQLAEKLGQTESLLAEKLGQTESLLTEKLGQTESQLTEKLTGLEENVHKECVKVYRNVQAVVVEESSKQSEAVTGAVAVTGKMNGKLSAVLGISIAALLVSIAGVVLQVLQLLGIL